MKRVLIICAAGMSSSMVAKKVMDYFATEEIAIEVDTTTALQASRIIAKDAFDLYLVSPQTKMYFESLEKSTVKVDKPILNIPPQAYITIPMSTLKLAKLIEDHI